MSYTPPKKMGRFHWTKPSNSCHSTRTTIKMRLICAQCASWLISHESILICVCYRWMTNASLYPLAGHGQIITLSRYIEHLTICRRPSNKNMKACSCKRTSGKLLTTHLQQLFFSKYILYDSSKYGFIVDAISIFGPKAPFSSRERVYWRWLVGSQ